MTDETYPVPAAWTNARIDAAGYAREHARSLDDSSGYWLEEAKRLDWIKAPTVADESDFAEENFAVRWFADGQLNVSANCLDRHLATRGDKVAA